MSINQNTTGILSLEESTNKRMTGRNKGCATDSQIHVQPFCLCVTYFGAFPPTFKYVGSDLSLAHSALTKVNTAAFFSDAENNVAAFFKGCL